MNHNPQNTIDALIMAGPGARLERPLDFEGGVIEIDGWHVVPCENGVAVYDGEWREDFANLDDALAFVNNTRVVAPVAPSPRSVWYRAALVIVSVLLAALPLAI